MGRINVTVSIIAGASVPNMSLQLATTCCAAPAQQACEPAQGKPGLLAWSLARARGVSLRVVSCRFLSCRCGCILFCSVLFCSALFWSVLFCSVPSLPCSAWRRFVVHCFVRLLFPGTVLVFVLFVVFLLVCVVWVCCALRCYDLSGWRRS